MNNKHFTRVLPMAILALCVAFTGFTGCAGGDMATVIVSIGNTTAKAEKPSVVDRLIAFFSLSTKLQAAPPPFEFIVRLDLTIEGPGIDLITHDIPLETGLITVDVPSGPKRVFTIVAYDNDYIRDMGGIATKDLAGGENTTIQITMGDLPRPVTWPGPLGVSMFGVNVQWNASTGAEGYYVYRSDHTSEGPYVMIAHVPGLSNTSYFDDKVNASGEYTYWYKVCGYNSYGTGTLSDYQWAMPGP